MIFWLLEFIDSVQLEIAVQQCALDEDSELVAIQEEIMVIHVYFKTCVSNLAPR